MMLMCKKADTGKSYRFWGQKVFSEVLQLFCLHSGQIPLALHGVKVNSNQHHCLHLYQARAKLPRTMEVSLSTRMIYEFPRWTYTKSFITEVIPKCR